MSAHKTIRLMLLDQHAIVRSGLVALLSQHDGFSVVAQAGDGRQGVELAAQLKPDIVLSGVHLPKLNGIDTTRQIGDVAPKTKVIGLSETRDRKLITAMLRAGAAGYLTTTCESEELFRAIRIVSEGKQYISPSIADAVLEEMRAPADDRTSQADHLSPRQREVLQLLAEGKTTRQIAAELGLSPKTVETHRCGVMDKLAIDNIADLTRYAIREGITPLEG